MSRFDCSILSRRENQVVDLYAKGYKASEIARMLNLSVKTISTYRTRIREKLGIADSTQWMALLRQTPIESPASVANPSEKAVLV